MASTQQGHESYGRAFEGRFAVVTGAAQGLGKAVAIGAAKAGANVFLVWVLFNLNLKALALFNPTNKEPMLCLFQRETSDRNAEGAAATATECSKFGVKSSSMGLDLTAPGAPDQLAKSALEFGSIDTLFLCAGIYPSASIEETDEALWEKVVGLNTKSSFFIVRAFTPHLKKIKKGAVVITSSVTGNRVVFPGLAACGFFLSGRFTWLRLHANQSPPSQLSTDAASKGGVNGLIRALALELAPWGIRVNGVEPGKIGTEGFNSLGDAEFIQGCINESPMGRIGTPEEVGDTLLFLATPASRFITGQVREFKEFGGRRQR